MFVVAELVELKSTNVPCQFRPHSRIGVPRQHSCYESPVMRTVPFLSFSSLPLSLSLLFFPFSRQTREQFQQTSLQSAVSHSDFNKQKIGFF